MTKLHTMITTHRVKKIADYIKDHTAEIHIADDKGFYPIQLAAREGLLQVVLLLLSRNADPGQTQNDNWFNEQCYRSALNLAIEYGHFHIARVLLACGARHHNIDASTKLTVSIELLSSLMYCFICKESTIPDELIIQLRHSTSQRKFDVIGGLIEFAIAKKQHQLATTLMTIAPPRQDANIPNAGFWALQQLGETVANEFCPTEDDRLLMLWHLKRFVLKGHAKQFSDIFHKENNDIKNKFKQVKKLFPQQDDLSLLTEAAAIQDIQGLNNLCNDVEEYIFGIQEMLSKSNYIALAAFLEIEKFDILKEILLQPYASDLVEFCIINFTGNLATEIVDDLKENDSHENFLNLLDSQWSRKGFFYQLTSVGVQMQNRPDKKTIAILNFLHSIHPKDFSQVELMRLAIQNSHGFEMPQRLKMISNFKTPTFQMHANYGNRVNRRLMVFFNRFENALIVNSLSQPSLLESIPDDIALHIISFLHSDDKLRIARRLSFGIYNVMLKDITTPAALTNEKKYHLQDRIEVLQKFKDLLVKESKYGNKNYLTCAVSSNLLLIAAAIYLSCVGYPMAAQEESVIHSFYHDPLIDGTTCSQHSQYTNEVCDDLSRAIEFCRELCDALPDPEAELFYLVGAIIMTFAAVISIWTFVIYYDHPDNFKLSKIANRIADKGFGTDEAPQSFGWASGNRDSRKVLKTCVEKLALLEKEYAETYPDEIKKDLTIKIEEITDADESDEKAALIETRPTSPSSVALAVLPPRASKKYSGTFWKVTDEASKELLVPLLEEDEKKSDDAENDTSFNFASGFG
jgi:hypothetical protein